MDKAVAAVVEGAAAHQPIPYKPGLSACFVGSVTAVETA
jgi:hypothetical protein